MKAFLLLMFLAIPFGVCAEEKIFLYGDYYNGMSREEVLKTEELDCGNFPDDMAVCKGRKVPFAGLEWTQFFQFRKNSLNCVAFGILASGEAIDQTLIWLLKEGFVPINAEAGRASMDYANLLGKKEEFQKEAERFAAELPSAPRLQAFFVKRSLADEYVATAMLPADAIVVKMGGINRGPELFISFQLASEAMPRRGR